MEHIRTHTRWLTVKEYVKLSKQNKQSCIFKADQSVKTRTHIYFV